MRRPLLLYPRPTGPTVPRSIRLRPLQSIGSSIAPRAPHIGRYQGLVASPPGRRTPLKSRPYETGLSGAPSRRSRQGHIMLQLGPARRLTDENESQPQVPGTLARLHLAGDDSGDCPNVRNRRLHRLQAGAAHPS